MIDYQAIIKELDIERIKQLLSTLDIPFQETASYLVMPTVCHNEDANEASWKLYYYKNTHIFYCYTECAGAMSIFKFLEKFYKVRDIEYDWYSDIYKIIIDCSGYNPYNNFRTPKYKSVLDKYIKADNIKLETYPNGIINCFIKYYPIEWLSENISKAAMDKFNIRYSTEQNKIIIPHYNINGELIGIRGRALNKWEIENIGKYLPVKIENKWYSHPLSLNLYGLNITKDNIKKTGYCFLFEGEKSVIKMEDFKQPNCSAAVCGSQFNKYALKLLVKSCKPKEIIICFDNEELPHSEKYFNKLYSIGKKYRNYCNFSFIYDREKLLDFKDSPVDKGEKIFNQLIQRRVKIK